MRNNALIWFRNKLFLPFVKAIMPYFPFPPPPLWASTYNAHKNNKNMVF